MSFYKPAFKKAIIALAVSTAFSVTSVMASGMAHHTAEYATDDRVFQRIASFPVFLNTDINIETVAEIVAASEDGNTLVYTDGKTAKLGFVDITDPAKPVAAGTVYVGGEPTSVAVMGNYALVAINTSASFIAASGKMLVVNIANRSIVTSFELGGQPDSVAVSPDGQYAAVVIENERDEDLGDGAPPQAPAGFMVILDLAGEPTDWSLRNVEMIGLADLYSDDPEPEYVDINQHNIAVVTLQENNHIVLVELASGHILNDFSAGSVDLENIDTSKNKLIELNSSLTSVLREPDGVSWISNKQFATANEGDLDGGSRGFTIFNLDGTVSYESASSVEHIIAQHGHFPDKRAGKKGNEPENVEFGKFGDEKFMFVGSERSSVVLVYKLNGKSHKAKGKFKSARSRSPKLVQVLPTAVKPEGLLAIPHRNLFIAAGEEDSRGDKIRSALSIYKLGEEANYPGVISANSADGTPIPWGALSGLAVDPEDDEIVYTVQDSFYKKSRILKMDIEETPAVIHQEIMLNDSMGKLAMIHPELVNTDGSVNLDPEGVSVRTEGGFWLVSEGRGTVGSSSRPFESFNLLIQVSDAGIIEQVVTLPAAVNARQIRFGFEGVTTVDTDKGEQVYVAFQREWAGDAAEHVRIGRYNTRTAEWTFFYYPIEIPASSNGGWVGLSDLTALSKDEFMLIERDNQGGPDAAIKRLYKFSVAGLTAVADNGETPAFPVVTKTLVRDLMPDLKSTGGLVLEKVEGLAVLANGTTLVVNDNDGVDDSNGETQLLRLEDLFEDDE